MRPRTKTPLNKRYFHKKRKIDKKDIAVLKKKIEAVDQKKYVRELENKKRKRHWRIY